MIPVTEKKRWARFAPAVLAAAILSVVSGCGYYVTVERGDTLYSIAGDYDLTVNDMIEANPDVKNPDRIYVGQKLRIPREKSLAGARSNPPAKETRVASASNDVTPRPAPQEERVEQRDLVEAPPRPAPVAVATPPAGHGQTGDRFVWPVSGKIIAYFGKGPDGRINEGINIAAPVGHKVVAAADGEVVVSDDRLKGYGNMIVVKHADSYLTIYAHNRLNVVAKGDKVRRGQVIAEVGDTGRADTPHLHFEVRKNIKTIDPLTVLPKP